MRCFLDKFTQLAQFLHDRRSRQFHLQPFLLIKYLSHFQLYGQNILQPICSSLGWSSSQFFIDIFGCLNFDTFVVVSISPLVFLPLSMGEVFWVWYFCVCVYILSLAFLSGVNERRGSVDFWAFCGFSGSNNMKSMFWGRFLIDCFYRSKECYSGKM